MGWRTGERAGVQEGQPMGGPAGGLAGLRAGDLAAGGRAGGRAGGLKSDASLDFINKRVACETRTGAVMSRERSCNRFFTAIHLEAFISLCILNQTG